MPPDFLTIIREFGFPTLVAIVVAVASWAGLKWLKLKFDTMFAIVTKTNESIPDTKVETVEKFSRFSNDIERLLITVQKDFHANWTHCFMGHNGVYSVGMQMIPFLRLQLMSEVLDPDVQVPSMTQEFSEYPLHLLKNVFLHFINYNMLIFRKDLEDIKVIDESEMEVSFIKSNNTMTERMFELGATAQYIVPLRDIKRNIVGMLTIYYLKDIPMTRKRQDDFRNYGVQLSMIIDRYGQKEVPVSSKRSK